MNKIVELSIKVTQSVNEIKMGTNKQKMGRSVQEVQIWVKQLPEKSKKRKKRNKEEEDMGIIK